MLLQREKATVTDRQVAETDSRIQEVIKVNARVLYSELWTSGWRPLAGCNDEIIILLASDLFIYECD